jgi:hypothetical protein
MRIVVYENDEASFMFSLSDVINQLQKHSDQGIQDATELKNALSLSLSQVITVHCDYFGCVMLNLLREGKGSVHCKVCGKAYLSNDLRSVPIGSRRNKITIDDTGECKKGIIKRLFDRKKRTTAMIQGEKHICPNGHAVLWVMTGIE